MGWAQNCGECDLMILWLSPPRVGVDGRLAGPRFHVDIYLSLHNSSRRPLAAETPKNADDVYLPAHNLDCIGQVLARPCGPVIGQPRD